MSIADRMRRVLALLRLIPTVLEGYLVTSALPSIVLPSLNGDCNRSAELGSRAQSNLV